MDTWANYLQFSAQAALLVMGVAAMSAGFARNSLFGRIVGMTLLLLYALSHA